MWKCPACETLNNENICVICGEPKPAAGGDAPPVATPTPAYPTPVRSVPREVPAYSPEMSGTSDGLDPTPRLEYRRSEESSSESSNAGWIIALLIFGIIALLIIVGSVNSYATDEGLNAPYQEEVKEQYIAVDTYDILPE